MDYAQYRSQIQTLIVSQDPDPDFDNILPAAIDYANERICRELNLINTVYTDQTTSLTANDRGCSIPDTFITVTNINVITPVGAGYELGRRAPLVPVSRDALDMLWPDNTTTGVPWMYCMVDQWSILVGPPPDEGYELEVIGTYRPAPLSENNPNTFLSDQLPDLFIAASMVFMSGYMRNFGAQQSDPAMSQSWENQYQLLKASADGEELRKRFWASSWSSQPVSPAAQPQRG